MARLRDYVFALIFVTAFFSVIMTAVLSTPVFAEDGSARILTKDDVKGFEKLTFYNTTKTNLIGTDPEGGEIDPLGSYGFMTRHRLVSTEEKEMVEADYGHIGQFHGRDISVRIIFSDFEKKPESFGERDGRYICIPECFRDNFHYDGDSLIQKMIFYYSDDETMTPIDMTNAFIVINGLNVDEYAGMTPDHQVFLSENSQLKSKTEGNFICYGNGPQGYSDHDISGDEDVKYQYNGIYYEENISNPLYYVCSVMYTLNGTENALYIEDTRKTGGFGIGWCLDLTTLHVTFNIKTKVENGSITEDVSNILYNEDQAITYFPDEDYVLDSITVDGTPIDISTAPSEYVFRNITQDHEISVVYKLPYKKINTEVVNGTITPSDEKILFGTSKQIDYSPNNGYILDSISVDNLPVKTEHCKNRYLFENVRDDHVIKVIYLKPDPPVKKVLDKNEEFINGKNAAVGDILTYEISYKNNLTQKADLTITDNVPAYTEFESATDGGVYDKGKVTWKITAMPQSTGKVRMKVRVLSSAKGNNISNYALEIIDGVNLMSNTVNNPVQDDPVKKVKDLKGRDINGKFIEKDQEIIYSIGIKNASSEDKNVQIKDSIPEGMSFISAENGGTVKNGTVSWNTVLKAGEEKQVGFKVKAVKEGRQYINQAKVIMDGVEMTTNKVENWTLQKPKKEVKQKGVSIDGKDVSSGENIDYYITVKNTSSKTADIRIEDRLPDHLEVISIDNEGRKENGTITWYLKEVPAGESKAVRFTAKIKGEADPVKIVNKAYMTIGDRKLETNETTVNVPAVRKIEVLGEKISPLIKHETASANSVLGERKIPTGDRGDILVFLLVAMCAFAGIVVVRIKNA